MDSVRVTAYSLYNEDDQTLIRAAGSSERDRRIRSGKCSSGYRQEFVAGLAGHWPGWPN